MHSCSEHDILNRTLTLAAKRVSDGALPARLARFVKQYFLCCAAEDGSLALFIYKRSGLECVFRQNGIPDRTKERLSVRSE